MFPTQDALLFNAQTLQFRNLETNDTLTLEDELEVIEERIESGFNELENFAIAIIEGDEGDLEEFELAMAQELRNMHVQATMVGVGGRENMTNELLITTAVILLIEFNFLNNLAGDIAAGRVSIGQLRNRMRMFSNKIRNAYWNGRTFVARNTGFREERRVLQPAEHCADCVDLAAEGWQPINTLPNPGDGSTQCLSNDRCIKEFRR